MNNEEEIKRQIKMIERKWSFKFLYIGMYILFLIITIPAAQHIPIFVHFFDGVVGLMIGYFILKLD